MIIPRFTLDQDSKTLSINILARYCRLKDLEVEVDENNFLFYCWPYFLRLALPGNIVENENSKSSFNSDTGEFTFQFDKAIEGEIFENLDFITKFLVKKVDSFDADTDENKIEILCGDNMDEEDVTSSDLTHLLMCGFGFALQNGINFKSAYAEYYDVFEINPAEVKLLERRKLRLQKENMKFDKEHYICDLIECEEIDDIMKPTAPWENIDIVSLKFTNKELDFLKDLPNKVHKLDEKQIDYVHNTLMDILYAYCYDQRVSGYEENPESGWNIVTLSASLCWLDAFQIPREALISSFRRSLIYPLYRNFNLSLKILEDLKKLLNLGPKVIIKCLIHIYYIFLTGNSCRYILNNLFIKDYIIYIMNLDASKWQSYLQSFSEVIICKNDLGLHLLEIETCVSQDESIIESDEDSDDTSDSSSSEFEDQSKLPHNSKVDINPDTLADKIKKNLGLHLPQIETCIPQDGSIMGCQDEDCDDTSDSSSELDDQSNLPHSFNGGVNPDTLCDKILKLSVT